MVFLSLVEEATQIAVFNSFSCYMLLLLIGATLFTFIIYFFHSYSLTQRCIYLRHISRHREPCKKCYLRQRKQLCSFYSSRQQDKNNIVTSEDEMILKREAEMESAKKGRYTTLSRLNSLFNIYCLLLLYKFREIKCQDNFHFESHVALLFSPILSIILYDAQKHYVK